MKLPLHIGHWLVSSILPRSPISALGRVLPSQAGGIGHPFMGLYSPSSFHSLPEHLLCSMLALGTGSSDRPSLITGHSHGV